MDPARQQELFQAIKDDDAGKVRSLLEHEAAPVRVQNETGLSALLAAVYHGRGEISRVLAEKWAPLDIFEATAMGDAARVRELIEANPELARVSSPDGFPLIGLAAAFGHGAVVDLLLSKGADVNASATNGTGYTALTAAVAQKHRDIAALLLDRGADVNHRYGNRWSPLHETALQGAADMAALLLAHGADAGATTDEGKTPLQIARENQRADVVKILEGRGGLS